MKIKKNIAFGVNCDESKIQNLSEEEILIAVKTFINDEESNLEVFNYDSRMRISLSNNRIVTL